MAWRLAPQAWPETGQRLITHPRTANGAAVVLALALGYQVGVLAWGIVPEAPAATPVQQSSAPAAPARNDSPESSPTAKLASLHLFGTAQQGESRDAESGEAPANAPETQLDLTLKGVYAPGSGEGLAIISAGGGREKVYSAGDTIQGNARITRIFADRVLLRRNGRAETLRMAGKKKTEESASQRRTGGDSSGKQSEIAQRARKLRRELLENPGKLARMVRFQPHIRDGELVGYRIQPREAEAKLLRNLGLRPSDIVTRVNGRRLSDPREANKALRGLRDAERIRLTLLRDGQRKTLSVSLGEPGG